MVYDIFLEATRQAFSERRRGEGSYRPHLACPRHVAAGEGSTLFDKRAPFRPGLPLTVTFQTTNSLKKAFSAFAGFPTPPPTLLRKTARWLRFELPSSLTPKKSRNAVQLFHLGPHLLLTGAMEIAYRSWRERFSMGCKEFAKTWY